MAINARLDLELDRATGTFAVADTSTRLYIYDGDISLSVGGWTRDEVAIGQDGKTMYEPYLQIVYGGMVLAEAKLSGVEDPPEDEEDYSMTGTLSTNTVQMAAMFCGCVASETMRQFEARIFSTTSANPIATGRVSMWNFPSGGANPVNLPSASEVLAGLRTGLDNHVENENIHVTAQEKAAWTGKQNALTFDNAPTEGSQNPVTSGGVKTTLDAEAQARAQNDTTLGNAISAEAAARQEADNELGEDIAEERGRAEGEENRIQGDLNTHKENTTIHVTATDKAAWNAKVDPATLLGYVNGGAYDSETRRILLKHGDATVAWIDANPFIVDGMVESAYITPDGAYLVITFNTDAGKQPINIPLTDIFNPANYYDKTATNALLGNKEDIFTPAEIALPNLVLSVNAVVKEGAQKFVVRIPTTDGLPSPSTSAPLMDGTASAGSSDAYARGDHVHPTDTSRASTEDVVLTQEYSSAWTIEPSDYQGLPVTIVWVDGAGWEIAINGNVYPEVVSTDKNATSIIYNIAPLSFSFTATRTALPGYRLGPDDQSNPNRDKPLASEAEAEALRTGKQDVLSAQQLANIAAVSDALAFDATQSYVAGDPVVYNGTLYTFTAIHAGAWTGSDVSAVDIIARLAGKLDKSGGTMTGSLTMGGGNLITFSDQSGTRTMSIGINGNIFEINLYSYDTLTYTWRTPYNSGVFALASELLNKLDSTSAAPAFSTDSRVSYPVGSHVTYNGKLYKCTTATTGGTWDARKWTADTMTDPDAVLDITAQNQLRVVAKDGTLLWAQGYDLASTSSATLACDAANNFTFADGATSQAFTLPTAPTGKVGDFGLDIDNSANTGAATITLTGLDSTFSVVVPEGESLNDMLSIAAGELARFYITLSTFRVNNLPTWHIVKQVVENGGAQS